jgi:hypothetical protein
MDANNSYGQLYVDDQKRENEINKEGKCIIKNEQNKKKKKKRNSF